MAFTEDRVRTTVFVDGRQAINELGKLEMEASDLAKSLKQMKKNTDEYVQTNAQLKKTRDDVAKLRSEIGLTGMTMTQLKRYASELYREMNNGATAGTAKHDELKRKFQEVTAVINQQQQSIRDVGGWWGKLKTSFSQFGPMAMAAGAIGMIFNVIMQLIPSMQELIGNNANLSDSLADVMKTTGMTREEVELLNKQLGEIDTRTSADELNKIAIVAGQLGISKKDVIGFTDSVDKLNVALGDEFTGGAEEVSKEMGALRNIFSDVKSDDVGQDMLKIGNAINKLGASGAATGPVVSDFASRIGGVGISLGLTSGQVLGLSATLQELNVGTERGSTAVVSILNKMGQNYQSFAKVAGMSTAEFKDLLDKDLYSAFVKVVEGAGKSKASMTGFASLLDELKIDGAGASEVIAKLSSNTVMLNEKVHLSNKALGETSSIMDEFNIKNNTLAAKLEKIQKAITGAFTNPTIMNFLDRMVSGLASFIKPADTAQVKLSQLRNEFNLEIEVLKRGNFTQEQRKQVIQDINEKYGAYLPNLLSEKSSLEDIEKAQKAVNQQIMGKIIMMDYEEEITAVYKKQKGAAEALLATEKSRQKMNIQTFSGESGYSPQQLAIIEKQRKTFEQVNKGIVAGTDGAAKEVEEKYTKIAATLGLNFDQLKKIAGANENNKPGGTGGGTGGSSGKEDKEFEKILEGWRKLNQDVEALEEKNRIARLDKNQQELANLDGHYRALIEKAAENLAAGEKLDGLSKEQRLAMETAYWQQVDTITENWQAAHREKKAQFEQEDRERDAAERARMLEQDAQKQEQQRKFLADKQALIQEIDFGNLTEEQRKHQIELAEIDAHYNALLERARQFGLSEEEIATINAQRDNDIKKAQAAENLRIKQAEVDAYGSMMSDFSSLLAATNQFIGKSGSEMTEFQKGLTLAQIAIDTATSLSATIAGATKAASMKGPAAPFLLAGYIATGIATVLGAVSKAKSSLSTANIPKPPESGNPPKYAKGGVPEGALHSGGGIALVNGSGAKIGEMEGGEPILSRDTYKNNYALVSELLYSSMYRGGAAITPNFDKIDTALSYRIFATGGISPGGGNTSAPVVSLGTGSAEVAQLLAALLAEQKATRAELANFKTNLRAYMVWDDFEDAQKQIDTIRNKAKLS